MKTAVDTSVLLDVLRPDPHFGEASRRALRQAYDTGALVACDVVWAELRAHFPDEATFCRATQQLGLGFDPIRPEAAAEAGRLWRERRRRGEGRDRVVADYLIGSHALLQAEALLTRDRGFFRTAFEGLQVITP